MVLATDSGLTGRQLEVLAVIASACKQGVSPTVREIGSALGVSGPAVQRYINVLTEAGYVNHQPRLMRTLRVTDRGWALLG